MSFDFVGDVSIGLVTNFVENRTNICFSNIERMMLIKLGGYEGI